MSGKGARMKRWHSNKNRQAADKVEAKFQQGIMLVKDLDKKEFKRFIDGLTYAWQGYDCMRRVKTIDEKESIDIDEPEKFLETEAK